MKRFVVLTACVFTLTACFSGMFVNHRILADQTEAVQSTTDDKMRNADVIALVGLGLSDDVVIDKIHAAKSTDFDTSVAGLKSLKDAKVSDSVIRAMINPAAQTNSANPNTGIQNPPTPGDAQQQPATNAAPSNKPRVFLEAASHGPNQNANRDQSMEMSKDFERDCGDVSVTINQQMADYTVSLNHIEAGLYRDNQIQVANKTGDLISKTKEGGSIRSGMKKACSLILDDWNKKSK